MSSKNPFEEKLDYCLNKDRIPAGLSKEEARLHVLNRIKADKQASGNSGAPMFLRVAAAVLVLVVGGFVAWYFIGVNVIENDGHGISEFSLPDGSVVKLNQNSVASYNNALWFIRREVTLEQGEAFFEVNKGEKFTVETIKGDVVVLGTSFNVSLRNENLQVACKTGKVSVQLASGGNPILLNPGQGVNMAENMNEPVELDTDKIGNWTIGEFTFENVSVTDVFDTIQANTDYDFKISDNIDLNYTGQFNSNQPITEILDIVCIPLNLNYSIDSEVKTILITKN